MTVPTPYAAASSVTDAQRVRLYRDLREQAARLDRRRLQRVRALLARDADSLGRGAAARLPASHRRGRG